MACLQVIPHIVIEADTGRSFFYLFLFSALITSIVLDLNRLTNP